MFKRTLQPILLDFARQFPVIALLGPRQSGKTTLARHAFNHYHYVSLEDADKRFLATHDPRRFLAEFENAPGVILDEFQHVPEILSYIQTMVDTAYRPGYFILTGSQNFLLNQAISQSLAGRVGILTLLPLSINECSKENILKETAEESMFYGGYPRIFDQHFAPTRLYPAYVQTYLERDVRQIINVTNLGTFQRFVQLCAGRIGQLLNLSSLANDCGISVPTARAWITLLEASYIIFLLQPHHKNFNKRLIKTPKLYFYDTGVACSLLGIESAKALLNHYLRGGLFESFIISDLLKHFFNQGRIPRIYFWRDSQGHEVDVIIEQETQLYPIEIKSGITLSRDFVTGIDFWNQLARNQGGAVIYAGSENHGLGTLDLISWKSIDTLFTPKKTGSN